MNVTKDWCLRMAQLEGNSEIGVGSLAIDPSFDGPVNSFGLIHNLFDRPEGHDEVVEVMRSMGFPVRGTF